MSVNLFNANFYRAANSDLASLSDAQALSHFQNYGLNEGRAFSPFANLNFYRSSNADLAGFNNQQAFTHLQNNGVREGRSFSPFVSLSFYRDVNGDLAGLNNEQLFEHLRNNGLNEGRRFSPFVDLNLYRVANPDLSGARLDNRQLLEHLARDGVAQGRRFSVAFDLNYYRNANSDLATSGLNNTQLLEHFEISGLREGRASSESFNVSYYFSNNSDLRSPGSSYEQAYRHFELYGFREGRLGAPSVELSVPTDPAIGNTLNTAFSLGVLNGSRSVREFVGTTDRNDYYRFTLASTSNFNLSLGDVTSTTQVELILDKNSNGQFDDGSLYSDYSYSTENATISSPLGAGTYFIRVNAYSNSTNTNYTLGVSATPTRPTSPRDPGNSLSTALDIGALSGSRSFSDFVGSVDSDDYYRFSLASKRNFNLSLSGLNDSTQVNLIWDSNNNRQVDYNETLVEDYGYSNDDALISSFLEAGTYFVGVNASYGSTNTNYTLNLSV